MTRALLIAMVLVGCGTSDGSSGDDGDGGSLTCDAKGPCANDVAPTQDKIDTCEMDLADPTCGAKFRAMGECIFSHHTCDANGKSSVTPGSCIAEAQAYQACTGN